MDDRTVQAGGGHSSGSAQPVAVHTPVLLESAVALLEPRAGATYLDATFGEGGHSRAILQAADCSVVALDCDPRAAVFAERLRQDYPQRFTFYDTNFSSLQTIPETRFAGVLMDLGVSSAQLDEAERGFSFRKQAPLDMRLNPREGRAASEFLQTAERADLVRAIRDYGEETSWYRIVEGILQAQGSDRLNTTLGLAELVAELAGRRPGKAIHPATRTFQGIRIAVNDELEVLTAALPMAFDRLELGGVLAVISFHSLEDRIVKRFCRRMAGRPEHRLDSTPQDEREVRAELLTRRPLAPAADEIAANPRSRSARLRAIRRLT